MTEKKNQRIWRCLHGPDQPYWLGKPCPCDTDTTACSDRLVAEVVGHFFSLGTVVYEAAAAVRRTGSFIQLPPYWEELLVTNGEVMFKENMAEEDPGEEVKPA